MAEETNGSARISVKEVYLELQQLRSSVEKIANSLPGMKDQLDDLERDVNRKLSDHEERIRRVEMRIWQGMALVSAIAALTPILLNLMP